MKTQLNYLRWWDIGFITLVLFGKPIWDSTYIFFTTDAAVLAQGTEFTVSDNIYGIITEIIALAVVWLYLRLRRFDFSVWQYKITWKGTLGAIGLFLFFSIVMDMIDIVAYGFQGAFSFSDEPGIFAVAREIEWSLLVFSFLNGFYEEIFFLGICTMVEERYQKPALIYALVIRTTFHTYQGLLSAFSIGLVIGLIYYTAYRKKSQNLYPYMLSHAIADIIGAGIIGLW